MLTDDTIYGKMKELSCSLIFSPLADVNVEECEVPEYSIDKAIERPCHAFKNPFNRTYQNYFRYACNTDQPALRRNWFCQTGQRPFAALINQQNVKNWRNDETLQCNQVYQFPDKKKVCILSTISMQNRNTFFRKTNKKPKKKNRINRNVKAAFPFIRIFIRRTVSVRLLSMSKIRIKLFLMFFFPFVRISARINNRTWIRTNGNTNIKNSAIQICDTDKSRPSKVCRIKNTYQSKRSLITFFFL